MSSPRPASPPAAKPESPSASTTTVLVWGPEHGSRADLTAFLRTRRAEGWRVERFAPRVVEGPAYGALIVLRRADRPSPELDRPSSPADRRTASEPQRPPASLLPSPPAVPGAPAR